MAPKWTHNPISQKLGAPVALSKPTAFAWEGDKTQHVVYVGSDGNVHELWFRKGGMNPQWQYGGAPPAVGEPSGFSWEHDKTQHILYRAADNNVHELWFKHGMMGKAVWTYGGALNAKAGAPPAASDAMGFAWEADKTQHVIYRGMDNQTHELWFNKGMMGKGEWKYGGAISAKTGAPLADGMPWGFAWEGDHTMHIVFRGQDSNIHELWFSKGMTGGAWKYGAALNRMANGPVAGSDPVGFAWEDDNSQHVVYRGQDNQIHELWFKK